MCKELGFIQTLSTFSWENVLVLVNKSSTGENTPSSSSTPPPPVPPPPQSAVHSHHKLGKDKQKTTEGTSSSSSFHELFNTYQDTQSASIDSIDIARSFARWFVALLYNHHQLDDHDGKWNSFEIFSYIRCIGVCVRVFISDKVS